MKVTVEQVTAKLQEYADQYKDGKPEQRVGQFLMNELVPEAKDSEVFYQENSTRAIALFMERFVDTGA